MIDDFARFATVHRTVTFSLDGLMDDESAACVLMTLGVGLAPESYPLPGASSGKGRWMACGLRSDGVVELWPSPGAALSSKRGLELWLLDTGLPYALILP